MICSPWSSMQQRCTILGVVMHHQPKLLNSAPDLHCFERSCRQGSYLEVVHQRCTARVVNLSEGKERNLHRHTYLDHYVSAYPGEAGGSAIHLPAGRRCMQVGWSTCCRAGNEGISGGRRGRGTFPGVLRRATKPWVAAEQRTTLFVRPASMPKLITLFRNT